MPANTVQIHVEVPKSPQVRISVANTARDGTGTLGTVYTAGADGSFFKGLRVQAEVTTTADAVRIFVQIGGAGNNELVKEIIIPAVTPSTTVEAASYEWFPPAGMQLGAGDIVKASTDQGLTYNVRLHGGGDY